jgi:N-acetylglutamate synthase-like GNAT family acetyltransferase
VGFRAEDVSSALPFEELRICPLLKFPGAPVPGNSVNFTIRKATPLDVPVLQSLIDRSVRGLQVEDYSPTQIDSALASVYGVDSQLIADGTYFVVETTAGTSSVSESDRRQPAIVGCGGWSQRKTLYGGDHWTGREDSMLDPQTDAAKIRAFFVDPAWARRGIGSLILDACECAAIAAGFRTLEMGATLTGVPFYKARGYKELEALEVPLKNGEAMAIVRMAKAVAMPHVATGPSTAQAAG